MRRFITFNCLHRRAEFLRQDSLGSNTLLTPGQSEAKVGVLGSADKATDCDAGRRHGATTQVGQGRGKGFVGSGTSIQAPWGSGGSLAAAVCCSGSCEGSGYIAVSLSL